MIKTRPPPLEGALLERSCRPFPLWFHGVCVIVGQPARSSVVPSSPFSLREPLGTRRALCVVFSFVVRVRECILLGARSEAGGFPMEKDTDESVSEALFIYLFSYLPPGAEALQRRKRLHGSVDNRMGKVQ